MALGGAMFLFHVVLSLLGLLLRLPRGLLLGLVLFILGLVLLELVHPSPRHAPTRATVAPVTSQVTR